MSFDPSLLMRNSFLGDTPGDPLQGGQAPQGVNPATTQGTDAVSRELMSQIQQLQAPSAPPATASPLQQFFALLSAHQGASLLQQPSAANGAEKAVADERAAPDKYEAQRLTDFEKARALRLQMMMHDADNAAKAAVAEGNHKSALSLREKADQYGMDLQNLRNKGAADVAGIRASATRDAASIRASKQAAGSSKWPAEVMTSFRGDLSQIHSDRTKGLISDEERDARVDAAYNKANALSDASTGTGRHMSTPTNINAAAIPNQLTPLPAPSASGKAPTSKAASTKAGGEPTLTGGGNPGQPSSDTSYSLQTRKTLFSQGN